jgi:hypothetical protein
VGKNANEDERERHNKEFAKNNPAMPNWEKHQKEQEEQKAEEAKKAKAKRGKHAK